MLTRLAAWKARVHMNIPLCHGQVSHPAPICLDLSICCQSLVMRRVDPFFDTLAAESKLMAGLEKAFM
jgi:hypothetical protein